MKKIGIISWQKDSQYAFSLAKDLAGDFLKIPVKNRFSYIWNFFKSLIVIKKKRYNFLILEIPPIYLIYLIPFYHKRDVIVASHSNVFLLSRWWHKLHQYFLKFFLKKIKGLVVHNEKLLDLLKDYPGEKLVIEPPPRKLKIEVDLNKKKEEIKTCLVSLSYSPDEPIEELISALKEIENINFYLSGDYSKFPYYRRYQKIKNIVFTGYLKEEEYEKLLDNVDFVIGLTTRDYTCLQSGYDALGATKPFLTSDKEILRKYFYKGTVFVSNKKEDIKRGIKEILTRYEILKEEIKELKKVKMENWQNNMRKLKEFIYGN